MARHYIKVPAFVRDYFPGGAPDNWREAIVADATDGGRRMTIEPMLPNERGPRIAVHGERYCFWLGKDEFRSDTLFVMRMEVARDPRQQVHDYIGTFKLWPGGNPEGFDSVAGLLGEESTEPESDDETETAGPEPGPLVLRAVSEVPAALGEFRPTVEAIEPGDVPELVNSFRRFWRRYRLKGRLDLPARLESVLQGSVTPSRMDPSEWRLLSSQFGFGALNGVVLDGLSAERFQQVLEDLSSLPMDAHGRAALWTGLLRGLGPSELRFELHQVAAVLLNIAEEGAAGERLLEEGIVRALRDVAVRDGDGELEEVAVAAGAAEDPLKHVAVWAKSLQFADSLVEDERPPTTERDGIPATRLERPGITRWVARVSLPDIGELRKLVSDAGLAITEAESWMVGEAVPELLSALEAMGALRDHLDREVSRLPAPVEVSELGRQATAAAAELSSLLGEARTEELLNSSDVMPDDLLAIVKLLRRRQDLELAPKWLVWPDQDPPFDLEAAGMFEMALLLADSERRHRWQKFLDYLLQIGEPATVRWLRPPVDGASVEDTLEEWFDGTRVFLAGLSAEEQAAVLSDPGMSPAALREVDREVNDLASRLSEESSGRLWKAVKEWSPGSRLALVRALSQRVDEFCRSTQLSATFVSAGMLEEWAGRSIENEAPRRLAISVQHNWVGLKGVQPTLTLVQDDPHRDLAYFDAPMALESEEPREWTLRMRWSAKGEWRTNWPAEYPSIEPEQLSVARYQWRRDAEGEPYHHTFRLRIPVRVPHHRRKSLEVSVTLEDATTGEVLLPDHAFRWESLQSTSVPITVVWSTAGRPDDVEQHPIGPQARASTILDRLEALSCTAVIAPRRFGKTTLVNYLANALPARGIYAVPPVVCTEHRLVQGIDYSALWSQISDALYGAFDTGLPGGWQGPLPPERAFDAVRRAARKRGHKAIVLLFDEAQFFFPLDRGHEIGSRLKARLEGAWCVPAKDMVPVLFCFVGLPPLVQRAGADLTGLLVPIEARDMTEEELRPLIDKKVPSLQTTRGLRAELARTSGNLFILRVLLNRLTERVRRERRVWASIDDLVVVSRALASDLREGREEPLAAYIRDVLNEADDVNEWAPMACVPVAAAVAEVRPVATSFNDLMTRAAERLNEWSRASFADARGRPVYDEDTVRRHFGRLAELKVVSDTGQFDSPYLDAWLSGLARRWTADDAFHTALFSGGQRRIRLPSTAHVAHESGSTRILKVEDHLGPLAFRVRRLQDEGDRTVFLESMAMFDSLRAAANRGEDGAAFIFRLEDVGLSAADSRDAVQVYRWVDGEDLGSKVGCLAPEHVLDIGIKLGRALMLLHRRGILHRDIQPGNVILDEGEDSSFDFRPVLIDFGFARVVGAGMRTRLAGECAAPEVCLDQPEWSRAADVFGLGATLRAVLDPKARDANDINVVLKKALATVPADRSSAEALTAELQDLAQRLEVQQRREGAWSCVRRRLGRGAYTPELSATVNRHRTVLELLELGSYRTLEEKHRVVADIVNQFVERRTRAGLKGIAAATKSSSVAVLHALRVLHAHPDTILHPDHKKALAQYRAAKPSEQSDVVRDGITMVSRHLQIPALAALLEVYV